MTARSVTLPPMLHGARMGQEERAMSNRAWTWRFLAGLAGLTVVAVAATVAVVWLMSMPY